MHAIRPMSSAPPATSSSRSCPTWSPPTGRCGSPSRRPACTCSTPRSAAARPAAVPAAGAADDPGPRGRRGRRRVGDGVDAALARPPGGRPPRAGARRVRRAGGHRRRQAVPRCPTTSSFPDAVAAVGTGRTASGSSSSSRRRPDDVVLVPSAAGGLGWLLVQAAQAGAPAWWPRPAAPSGSPRSPSSRRPRRRLREPGWADRVRERVDGVTARVRRGRRRRRPGGLELLRPGWPAGDVRLLGGRPDPFDTDDLVAAGSRRAGASARG